MSRKKISQIFIFLACLSVLLFGVLVRPKLFYLPEKGNRPDYLFEDMRLVEFVKGVKTMEMSASSASFERDSELLNMKNLEAVFLPKGQKPVHLLSPDARLYLTTGAISLYHPTINMVLSDTPIQLQSKTAIWRSREGELLATGNVRLVREGLTLSSETLEMDQVSGRVRFFGRAQARWVF
jgi:LPS export ABC transporter protein LptC